MDIEGKLPGWLDKLLKTTFSEYCEAHNGIRKNRYCLDCCESFCAVCASTHNSQTSHECFQLKRLRYNDAITVDEIGQLIDCAAIKTYIMKDVYTILLRPKPIPQIPVITKFKCLKCNAFIQGSFLYCSLICKVEHALQQGIDIQSIVVLDLEEPKFDALKFANILLAGETLADDDGEGSSALIFSETNPLRHELGASLLDLSAVKKTS